MELISTKIIDRALKYFEGYKFTTQEFIVHFKSSFLNDYNNITKLYGVGGKGSGKYFSANSFLAKTLSHHQGKRIVIFLDYIKAPPSWGSPVIALWEHNPDNIETIRIKTSVEDDIREIINRKNYKNTQKQSLILSRIGQGDFRKALLIYWKKCAVTGCDDPNLLIASHIKPWSFCDNVERLDLFNGLLLIPNLDRLFDRGMISFSDDGKLLISKFVSKNNLSILGVSFNSKIKLDKKHLKYIKYHRQNVFLQKAKT